MLHDIELTNVGDSDSDSESMPSLPPLPPMNTSDNKAIPKFKKKYLKKTHSVAVMNTDEARKSIRRSKSSNSMINTTHISLRSSDASFKRSNSSSRYKNNLLVKAMKDQKKLNAIVDGTSNGDNNKINPDIEFLRDILQVRDQSRAYKDVKLLGKDTDFEYTVPIRPLMKVLYQLKRIKMVKDAIFLIVLWVSFGKYLFF
jgi:hypothetical protein